MSRQQTRLPDATPSAPTAPTEAPRALPVDFLVGMRKVGPNSYSVVKVRMVDGKPVEYIVDDLAEPMEYTARTIALVLAKMVETGEIP